MSRTHQLYIPKAEFDWEYYIQNNPDLQKAGLSNLEVAYRHWTVYGCHENRPIRSLKSGEVTKVQLKPGEKLVSNLPRLTSSSLSRNAPPTPLPMDLDYKVAILIHIFDITMFPFFINNLNYLNSRYSSCNFDVFINIVEENSPYTGDLKTAVEEHVSKINNPNVSYFFSENRGGDIGGFLLLSKYIVGCGTDYKYVIFAHSKARAQWRKELCQTLFNLKYESLPEYKEVGLIGSKKWIFTFDPISHPEEFRRFKFHLDTLCENYEVDCNRPWQFVAGTMFLAHMEVIRYIVYHGWDHIYFKLNKPESIDANWVTIVTEEYRKDTRGVGNDLQYRIKYGKSLHPDYMIEHAFERVIGLICNHLNLKIVGL